MPYVGQSESILVSETDEAPTTNSGGTGTGFPTGTNILGVGSTTATITLGTTSNLTVNVGEVVAILGVNDEGRSNGAGGNFIESDVSASGNPRLVFTNGVPTYGYDEVFAYDASNNDLSSGAAPTTSFVDVDGTPKAVTTASTSQGFRAYAIDNPGSSTQPTPNYQLTTSAPDSSYFANFGNSIPQEDYLSQCFAFDFKYDGSNVQFASTFTVKNNLTASNPYTGSSYGTSVVFDLSAVSAYPSSVTVAMGNTVTVDSSDYDAPGNLTPSSCTDSGGTVHATIAPYENITMPDFTERFTVTPTATGTCTFTLQDPDVDIQSMPVTVTVTAS